MSRLVELRNCRRVYDNGRIIALDDVSFSVARGDFIGITGPSGSGKSTLLDVLCGLEEPSVGEVLFDGEVVRGRADWARLRAERIGFVFQSFYLIPSLTVAENIEIAMLWQGVSARDRRDRVAQLLERLGLSARGRQHPLQLSGGERQRVAIARALANRPTLIVADEPTGSLDSRSSADIINLLEELQHGGEITVVIVTHDKEIAARCDRRVELVDGRIVSDLRGPIPAVPTEVCA
ncbi:MULTISPECIES: ABC transporter ATP-binding protein [Alphaproteobacteria]|uniref:Peptide ABC transporter ATP-binding protein n=2 Tax=Alphaproteobacteria TaxID=28211 RepID=A0A512HCX4_9HYPH|nr:MULTISPECIES: ABC transporter ATP-binding protein [Alphaproteobacteria]GEO83302.1 peptide ABC transporter ATP-binding protein [Ciceribacter naphthalenivorans]GLR20303.1 peptide ABC transporter ATP-binding protein [Ciceribacter naphthalenivorans]GLT03159.1 peptide ABC transporter ATP-binding protein [Sphingomonas psychrolutea]